MATPRHLPLSLSILLFDVDFNLPLSFPFCFFQFGFHEREVFSAHRELVIGVNEADSITGTSGVIAWELGDQGRKGGGR